MPIGEMLTRKLGPLPTWGWMGIGTVGVGGLYLYEKHKGGGTAATAAATPTSTSASNVPDYVFQNYNEIPAAAAPPTTTTTPPVTQPAPGSTPTVTTPPTIGPGNTPANPGSHIYTSNGKMTLAQVAKAHNTTPAAIVATTHKNKNNIGKSLAAYFKRAKWDEPIPKGTTIVYVNG